MATLRLKPSALMQSLISTALTTGVLLTTMVSPNSVQAQDTQTASHTQNSRVESQIRSSVNPQSCVFILGAYKCF